MTAKLSFPRPHPGLGTGAQVWIARHGEVAEEWRSRAYGSLDVPLSPAGEERTATLGSSLGALGLLAVSSSPLGRARCLGEAAAAAAGVQLRVEEGLREFNRGHWQGLPREQLARERAEELSAYHADPWSWSGHGGETDAVILARAWPALERAVEAAQGASAALTTHYNVARVLLSAALGIPPSSSFALRLDTARAALLIDAPGGWTLGHLDVFDPRRVQLDDEEVRQRELPPAGGAQA